MDSGIKESFLSLIRLGIGHYNSAIPMDVDWLEIQSLAEKQGLYAIALDGIERLPQSSRPNQELLLEWIGEVLQEYEYRYKQYCKAIAELADFYNSHGFKMMVLKGYTCSLDWPKPNHRPCGDIDIWLFGKQKEADALLVKEKRIQIEKSHYHHTVFDWGDFMVENHYDFNHVHHHKSGPALERIFKELGKDDSHFVTLKGEKVYLPSQNLHTLFLLKHSMTDFAAFYVTLRPVLDWGFHVQKHHNEIDWKWLSGVINQYHMKDFFDSINAICVEDLGFQASIFPYVQYNPSLKEKVLADIFAPKYTREEPSFVISRMIYKLRRWTGNAWKHKLCYNESLWSGFWSGVWNHLLKPSSI